MSSKLAKALAVAFAGGLLTAAAVPALADDYRSDQINGRIQNENAKIREEYREGDISRGQARQLHREEQAIRHEEHEMKRDNGGYLTPSEQHKLNQQENAINRQINRESRE